MHRFVVTAVLLLLGSGSVIAQETVDKVTVNGITGEVSGAKKAPYQPGSFVTVEIAPANLIGYAYVVTVDNSEQLKAFVPPVVGATEAAVTATSGQAGPFDAARFDPGVSRATNNAELLKQFQDARDKVETVTIKAGAAISAVEQMERQTDRLLAEKGDWPETLTTTRELFLIGAYGSANSLPTKLAPTASDALILLQSAEERGCAADSLCDLVKSAAGAVQRLQNRILDEKLKQAKKDPSKKDDADQTDFAALDEAVKGLATQLTAVSSGITATRNRVDRWAAVMKRYPHAILSQRILIDRVSRRYVLTVTRRPVGAPLPAAGQPDPAIEKLATTMFEGHTRSRLLLATGVGVLFRPDVRTFEVQARVDGDTRKFFVAEKSTTRTEFKPLMTIGAYLSPVDNYAVDQKWTPRTFINVGTEISSSPTTYVIGGGVDFPAGISFNVGMTTYDGTRLGKGYTVGQEIPGVGTGTERVALVATLPTRTQRQIGYYASVLFRPAIFSAFRDLAK